jgi:hypothetical protein
VRWIVTASAFLVLSSMSTAARPSVEYWLCRSSTGVMGAQDRPCDPSQQTVAAPSSAEIAIQPASPVQPRPTERPRVNVPAQRPVPIENMFQPIVTLVWKMAFWVIAMLTLMTVGKIWLRGRLGNKRRGTAKRTPPRIDPTPGTVARPTEWTASLLRSLEWRRFEEVCEGIWRANGYTARGTGPGSDGGIDIVIADRQDADKIFAVAQCKAWSKPVGVEPVRALWGAKDHFGAQRAIFYSVSGFSTEASNFAAGKHLKLVTGDELLRQLQTLAEAERTALLSHVTRGDFSTPSCPKCEIKMIRKAGRAGRSDFWSCPNFGSCRTRPIAVRGAA